MSASTKQGSRNKYKNLISNTLLFGVSTFGSKVLVLLLTRLWTELLAPEVIGIAGLVTTTCNLILPVMYLCMAEAVLRFGTEKDYKRGDILSIGVITVLIGWGVLACCYPLLEKIPNIAGYGWLILLYCLTSAMRTVITTYIRATGLVRVFAIDGIATTAMTLGFNLLFMLGFKLGAAGYVLGTVVADGLSSLGLFFILRLHRFLRVRGVSHDAIRDMFRYALPLIPTAVAWWVTNASDKFFISGMIGLSALGIYDKAQTIPNLIIQVSAFFTRAWELSAFKEYKSPEGAKFFSNVFRSYYTFVFLVASGLILLIKPLTRVMLAKEYYEAWRYSSFLILAVSFSCLVTFLGAIYNAERKNIMVTVTTAIGALFNLLLNWLMIPQFKALGAACATFISFFVVFVIRAIDTRRYIKLNIKPWRIAFNLILLLAQIYIAQTEGKYWIAAECAIFAFILVFNLGQILFMLRRLFGMYLSRAKRKKPSANAQ